MNERLKALKYFQECILDAVQWKNHGLTLEFCFNNIWDETGKIRPDLDMKKDVVLLRFSFVHEFRVRNPLTEGMLESWKDVHIDHGYDEVWSVKEVEGSELLAQYKESPLPLHHLVVTYSSGKRHIDIIFSTMEVIRQGFQEFT